MKILWINSSGWKEGGAESYLLAVRPILEKKGHVIKILASDDRADMPHFSDYSYRAHAEGLLSPFFHTINPSGYFALKKVLREWEPDIVHVHTIGHGSPAILFPLKKYPALLTIHGPEAFLKSLLVWCFPDSYFRHGEHDPKDLNFIGKLRFAYQRYIVGIFYAVGFRNINTIISPSKYIQELAARDGYKSIVASFGVELFQHDPVTEEQLNHTLLYAGRLTKYKGVDYLLRAFPAVLARFPDAKLLVAGNGDQRENLELLSRELHISHAVEFLGHISREKLEETYAKTAVAVMPSVGVEAVGLSGIEAMSVGRPVIGSRVGGIPEWLKDGETGFLVPPKNSKAISEKIIQLFSNPDLLLRLMANARKQSEKFDLPPHVDRLLEIYGDTIQKINKTA